MRGWELASNRWTVGIGVLALAVAAVAATACSSGTSSSDKTATAAAGAPASTSAPASPTAQAAAPTAAAAPATSAAGPAVKLAAAPSGASLKDETGAVVTQYLTDGSGMTLYTYKNDVPDSGKSAVPANILPNWPPLTLASGTPTAGAGVTGTLGTMTGPDGSTWVTYKGKPLYHFKGDAAPGDTKGEGLLNVWYVVGP